MSSLLKLVSQLSDIDARPRASQKIAKVLGAEALIIFIRDDELNILLPAPGFIQTIISMKSWKPFLTECIGKKSHTGILHFPDKKNQKAALATAYKDDLVLLLLGGKPDMQKMEEIYCVMPLLATVLNYEQRKSETEVQLRIAEKSLLANNEVVNKLYAARKELQMSLAHLQKETKARQITEKELINQQRLLNELFRQAPAVIAVLQGSKHVFKLANPLYKRLVGGREVVGKTVREALPELKGQGIYEVLDEVYKSGEPYVGNEVAVKLDRKGNGVIEENYYNFVYQPSRNGKNKVTGIIVHAVDVTEQVLARKLLQESEERLRFMAESMPQKVFTATPDGEIDYFNPQWTEYTGLAFKEIIKWGWMQFIHPDDLDANIRQWKQSLSSGEPFQFESRFRRFDGVYRLHLSRAQALRGDNGKILIWVGSCTDIEDITQTSVRRDELELITIGLKEQRKQLLAINNSKDEFIALASHQLRTPATAVKQYISLMLSGFAGPITADQKQIIQTAYDSNERQLKIINDLLKTAQLDSSRYMLNKTYAVITDLINDIITELQPILAFKNQIVNIEASNEISKVNIDLDEIKLVFANLLENASKYSYPNSVITVKLFKKKQNLVIEINDTGVGISKNNERRIFDKFTRIDNELSDTVTGTGLGLYWVKQIIRLHGGTVKVNSELGKGSSFIVKLPI